MVLRSVALATFACLCPALAAAQQPLPAESLSTARAHALAALRPGRLVRLQVRGDGRVQGRFRGVTGDTILIGESAAPQRVPVPAMEMLWVRGGHTALGAIVGGTIAGAADAYLFYVIGTMICGMDGNETCRPVAFAVLGGLGGALGGALLGGTIGMLFPRWQRRFP